MPYKDIHRPGIPHPPFYNFLMDKSRFVNIWFIDDIKSILSTITRPLQTVVDKQEVVDGLFDLLRQYDVTTAQHCFEVAQITRNIYGELFKDQYDEKEADLLFRAALLHDIGKIGILSIMNEVPQPLRIKNLHINFGLYILSRFPYFEREIEITKPHHDHQGRNDIDWDSDEFSILTQILIVADAYHSITHERPGDPVHDWDYALKLMKDKKFPPKALEALERIRPLIEKYQL